MRPTRSPGAFDPPGGRARGVVVALVVAVCCATPCDARAQAPADAADAPVAAPGASGERRERFERFLTAPDDEAARLAETLLHEPPAVLASLARPASRPAVAPGAAVLLRVPGYDPPLAGVVVLPRTPPPATGYPLVVGVVGPPLGPEEFELRARFGAALAAGAAVLAPVETTAWLARPEPAAPVTGRDSWRLAPLCVAAERALPLDPRRRVFLLGEPAGRATPWQFSAVSTAFAAIHWVLPGDAAAFDADLAAAASPERRFVLHYGPRRGEEPARAMRRFARACAAEGGDVATIEDPRLEHGPTAVFAAPHAGRALSDLGPNRLPRRLAAAGFGRAGPRGGAGVCFVASAGEGVCAVAGLGSLAPEVVVDEFAGETPWTIDLPVTGPPIDWSAPAAWEASAAQPTPKVRGGALHLAAPDRARGKLSAFRLASWSGADVVDSFRLRVERR